MRNHACRIMCLVALAASTALGQVAGSGPAAGKVVLPLATMPVLPKKKLNWADIAKAFPVSLDGKDAQPGIDPFVLPLRFSSQGEGGDYREALAAGCLLALATEWAPATYDTMPMSGFGRPIKAEEAEQFYEPAVMAALARRSGKTHFIGGALARTAKGYGGAVEVYDAKGRLVKASGVEGGKDYFEAVGTLAVEALKTLGYTPTDKLSAFLRSRRCSRDSLLDLGDATGKDMRGQLDLFDKVLQRDPGFAELRGFRSHLVPITEQYNDMVKALDTAVTIAGLRRFDHRSIPAADVIAKLKVWLDQADKLVGADHPEVMADRLRLCVWDKKAPSPELRDKALAVLARYPDAVHLRMMVGHVHFDEYARTELYDPDLALAMYLQVSQDGRSAVRMPMIVPYYYVASPLLPLHRPRFVLAILDEVKELEAVSPSCIYMRARACFEAGRYDEAAKAAARYLSIPGEYKDEATFRSMTLGLQAISSVLAGRPEECRQVLRDRRTDIAATGVPEILEAYLDLVEGKGVDIDEVRKAPKHNDDWWYGQEVILYAQVELLRGTGELRAELANRLRSRQPDDRPLWFLYDAYDRREPKPEAVPFYDALEWLRGDEEWVRQAVADARKRHSGWEVPSAEAVGKVLSYFEPKRYALPKSESSWQDAKKYVYSLPLGGAASAARQLIREGKLQQAEEMALRYHRLTVEAGGDLQTYGNHLVYVVQDACRRARAASAPASRPAAK